MTFEELCEKTGLRCGEYSDNKFRTEGYKYGGWYYTGFDMSSSLVWEIPCDYILKEYAIVLKGNGKIKILTHITFIGETKPIVQGHYTNFNYNNPRLAELVKKAKDLINKYGIYDKRNKIEDIKDSINKDFD